MSSAAAARCRKGGAPGRVMRPAVVEHPSKPVVGTPFDGVNAAMTKDHVPSASRPGSLSSRAGVPYVFPPELVPLLYEKLQPEHPCLSGVEDETLVELLTTAFFASLETDEGERRWIRIVFAGNSEIGASPPLEASQRELSHWSELRFESPRPFTSEELLKLATVTRGERMYIEVKCKGRELSIIGLAREDLELAGDVFLKVVAARPGALSIRSGKERIFEYEGGAIVEASERFFFAAGPVRETLEASAIAAGLSQAETVDYLSVVSTVALGMVEHGRGGILVVSRQDPPDVPVRSPYRIRPSPVGELQREPPSARRFGLRSLAPDHVLAPSPELDRALRGALLGEGDRALRELAALTAMDGAAILTRGLAIVGFGIVLPVEGDTRVAEARDARADELLPFDLELRGTRHRAAAIYASRHPDSIVLIASQSGGIGCMLRRPSWPRVVLFRFGPRGVLRG